MAKRLSTIEEAVKAIKAGELVIVMDDENRERVSACLCEKRDLAIR